MAIVPTPPAWDTPHLTSVEFNKISSVLSFLSLRSGGFCELTQTQPQEILENTDHPVIFQNEEVDRDGGHADLENISRYYVKTAGRYMLSGFVAFSANATGFRASKLMVNGGTSSERTLTTTLRPTQTGGIEVFIPVGFRIVSLAVNDYVELRARQNSGGTLMTSVADAGSALTVMYLGA